METCARGARSSEWISMESFDFVNRANADYVEALYERYLKDPRSVDVNWQAFFAGFELAGGRGFERTPGPAAGLLTPGEIAADAEPLASGDPRRPRTLGIH